jgi:putative DNA primase/helicase
LGDILRGQGQNDGDGALPSRFIKVRFNVSFYDREDVFLREKLSHELGGIAAKCLRAYQQACKRGHFIQPRTAASLEREVLAASDPFAAMALDEFVPDANGTVVKSHAYARFRRWCEENDRQDLSRTTPENRFGIKLRAVTGFERIDVCRPHNQPRCWVGMRLRDKD